MAKKELTLYRKSGMPVDLSDREIYNVEWQAFYDKAAARAMLDMLKLQRFLSFGERILTKKHNKEVVVPFPTTDMAWKKLINQYEDTPIMIARTTDGKRVIGVIMDEAIG